MTYDVVLYGAGRAKGLIWNDVPHISEGKFGIIGLNINPLYRVNKFSGQACPSTSNTMKALMSVSM